MCQETASVKRKPYLGKSFLTALIFCAVCMSLALTASAKSVSPVKGELYRVNLSVYRVTKVNESKKTATASLVRLEGYRNPVEMPDSFWIGKYKVTISEIEDKALKNARSVTSFATNTELKKIGDNVFANCKDLKKIVIRSKKLTKVGTNTFKGIRKNARIEVCSKDLVKLLKKKGQGSSVAIRVTSEAKKKAFSLDKKYSAELLEYDYDKYAPGEYSLDKLAPKADKDVLKAFKELGMKVTVDPDAPATGVFSAANRRIILKEYGKHIYHETGHFLFFIAGNIDRTPEAMEIYNAEKGKVTASNKAYTSSSVSEYFGEAYRSYVLDRKALKAERPVTFAYVKRALEKVTDKQIQIVKGLYL